MGGAEGAAFRRTTAEAEGGVTRFAIRPTAIRPFHRQDGRNAIGRRLKAYYEDVASEPVPDRFLSLLDALDAAEKGGSKSGMGD
mgnify:CR=1 FL=1